MSRFGLDYSGTGVSALKEDSLSLSEVVVAETSGLAGRSASSVRLLYRYGVSVVGVSRAGQRFRDNVRHLDLRAGDVLLLLGTNERLKDLIVRQRLLPLQDRGQRVIQRNKAWFAAATFAAAIVAASVGLVYLPDRARCCRGNLRTGEYRSHLLGIRIGGMARYRFTRVDDPHRWCAAEYRRHRLLSSMA